MAYVKDWQQSELWKKILTRSKNALVSSSVWKMRYYEAANTYYSFVKYALSSNTLNLEALILPSALSSEVINLSM